MKDFFKLANEHALSKGGKCLSTKYVHYSDKLLWECSNQHQWEALYNSVVNKDSWCKKCYLETIKNGIKKAQALAINKGGKCLSTEYIQSHNKLIWECAKGHKWQATYASIYSGHWCQKCSKSLSEELCRKIFVDIFEKDFISLRPIWLKNKKSRLELDGYCAELNLAFEYNGPQHYKICNLFTKNDNQLNNIIKRDLFKNKVCKKRGITLITIREKVDIEIIKNDLIKFCKETNNESFIKKINEYKINNNFIYKNDRLINEVHELCKKNNYKCYSMEWFGAHHYLDFECNNGHLFKMTQSNFKSGYRCPNCCKNKRKTINDMFDLALSYDGICLSNKYINQNKILKWQCKNNHIWEASYSHIRNFGWCKKCK